MPIALEPQERRLFWLASDAEKPLATRPVFECEAFSRRTKLRYNAIREEAVVLDQNDSDTDFYAKIKDGILIGVKGWRNFPEAFSAEALDILTDRELLELFTGWPDAWHITEDDRKNSSTQPPSVAENGTALTTGTESVLTDQP